MLVSLLLLAAWPSELPAPPEEARDQLVSLTASGDTITAPDSSLAKAPKRARRVGLGTVSDRKFAGPGVRVGKVLRGSPAERGGLVAGDVILMLEGRPIQDRQAFASMVAELAPGQSVAAVVRRAERDWLVSFRLDEN